ncbi:MAG: hypothetical protein ACXADY_10535 [Candidatus Hodarchaeales archaeon]
MVGLSKNNKKIPSIEGQEVAEDLRVPYYETSVINQNTISPIFQELAETAVKKGLGIYRKKSKQTQ